MHHGDGKLLDIWGFPYKINNAQPKHCPNYVYEATTTLNSPITMGHAIFQKPLPILTMKINVGHIKFHPTLIF